MWRGLVVLFRLLWSSNPTTVSGREFSELLAISGEEFHARWLRDIDDVERKRQTFEAVRNRAEGRGIRASEWWISLAVDMAIAALRAGMGRLLGTVSATVRIVGAVLLTVLLLSNEAVAQECRDGMSHKVGCTAAELLPEGASVNTQSCPCRPGLVPTRASGCKCLPRPGGSTVTTTTSSTSTTKTTTTSTVTSTTRPASSSTVTSTTRPPSSTTTTTRPTDDPGACRPPGRDYSARINKANFQLLLNRSSPNVRHATNQERDCLEEARIAAVRDLVVILGDRAPRCKKKGLGCLSLLMGRIEMICPYRGCSFAPPGDDWNHNTPGGRDYQCSGATLNECHDEVLNNPEAIGGALAPYPDLRDALDVNDTLTGDGTFPWFEASAPRQDVGRRAQQFIIDTKRKFPPCGGANCKHLDQVLLTHHCAGLRKTGRPLPTECANADVTVEIARVRYENSCPAGDQHCQWFTRLHPFSGFQDRSTWTTPAKLIAIADIEHVVMEAWGVCQRLGDAVCSEANNARHKYVHLMENIGRGWTGVFPWPGVDPDQYLRHQGERELTPEEMLPLLEALYLKAGGNLHAMHESPPAGAMGSNAGLGELEGG